jgi:hypothetical protein
MALRGGKREGREGKEIRGREGRGKGGREGRWSYCKVVIMSKAAKWTSEA